MTELSQSQSQQFSVAETPGFRDSGKEEMAKDGDWLFRILIVLVILTFLTAILISLVQILNSIGPEVGLINEPVPLLNKATLATSILPVELPDGYLLSISLLFLSGILFMVARWRILNDPALRPRAGCPSCHNYFLMRVHRNRMDRLVSNVGIPVARFQCRDCQWNGVRIKLEQKPLSTVNENLLIPAADTTVKPITFDSFDRSSKNLEEMVVVAEEDEPAVGQPVAIEDLFESERPLPEETSGDVSPGESAATEEREPGQSQENGDGFEWAVIASPLGLNLRFNPQSDGAVMGTLEPGTIVQLLENKKLVDGMTWKQIRVNDQEGWVLQAFLDPCA